MSYVHADDENDSGRITELRRRLESEVRMQTGSEFSIFQDKEDILAGQQWRTSIRDKIAETTLLIAIVTPSYLKSDACRHEIELFLEREKQLHRDDLVIPVLYVYTEELKNTQDPIATELSNRQRFDWTRFRFEELSSDEIRKAIAELARQITTAMKRSEESEQASTDSEQPTPEDGLGLLELLATTEQAMSDLVTTINLLAQTTEKIGDETRSATKEIEDANSSGRPASVQLAIIHRLSRRLEEPVQDMEYLTNEYLDHIGLVDLGIDFFVNRVSTMDRDELEGAQEFRETLVTMSESSNVALDALEGYQKALVGTYSISSTLRPGLRRIHKSLTKIVASRVMFIAWRDEYTHALRQRLRDPN